MGYMGYGLCYGYISISLFTLYWSGGILSCFMWSGALDW